MPFDVREKDDQVARIEWLNASNMTRHQVHKILTHAWKATSLQGLCLKGPFDAISDGEAIGDISLNLISRAKQIITYMSI